MEFSFSGVNLFSANPARTFAFYQALGLPVVEIPKEEGPWYGAVLALQEGPKPSGDLDLEKHPGRGGRCQQPPWCFRPAGGWKSCISGFGGRV